MIQNAKKIALAALPARQDSPMQIRALRYSGVRPGRHPGLQSHGGGFPVRIKRGLEAPGGMRNDSEPSMRCRPKGPPCKTGIVIAF